MALQRGQHFRGHEQLPDPQQRSVGQCRHLRCPGQQRRRDRHQQSRHPHRGGCRKLCDRSFGPRKLVAGRRQRGGSGGPEQRFASGRCHLRGGRCQPRLQLQRFQQLFPDPQQLLAEPGQSVHHRVVVQRHRLVGLGRADRQTALHSDRLQLWHEHPVGQLCAGRLCEANGSYQCCILNTVPCTGVFHHLAGTYQQVDSTHVEINMYIDGQWQQRATLPGNLANTLNTAPVTIGASGSWGEFLNGVVDEASIYNRVLSPTEIQAIYAAGSAGKCPQTAPSPPVITAQPQSQTVAAWSSATFTVAATGTAPLTYQWRSNGADIPSGLRAAVTPLPMSSPVMPRPTPWSSQTALGACPAPEPHSMSRSQIQTMTDCRIGPR